MQKFLDAARLVVANSVKSVGAYMSDLFITASVTVSHHRSHPPTSVVEIVYHYGKWVPPYKQIILADPELTVFVFKIIIHKHEFYSSMWCSRCRNTQPTCRDCQRKRRNAPSLEEIEILFKNSTQVAKLEIDKMMHNVQNFRDACKMFKDATLLKNLSYLHFLRMVQSLTLKDNSHSSSFNFSDFDGFFRKCMVFYPVLEQLRNTGIKCKIYSDQELMIFVQFPNFWKRIYPKFENVSTRNEILALSMSMKILYRLVSTEYLFQSRKNRLVLEGRIAKRIIGGKFASLFN